MSDAFGLYLSRARLAAGLSQRGAAARLSVSPGYLSRVENGQASPGPDLISLAVEVFNLDSDAAHRLAGRIPEDVRALLMHPGAFDFVRGRSEYEGAGNAD